MEDWKTLIRKTKKDLKLLAVDYDGTLFNGSSSSLNHKAAASLLLKVLRKGVHVVVISARDASFRKNVIPLLQPFLHQNNSTCYFGGANGTYLTKVRANSLKKIYSYRMSVAEVRNILQVYDEIRQELKLEPRDYITQGIQSFEAFLRDPKQWQGFISRTMLQWSQQYDGALFIEQSKISCVLPKKQQIQNKLLKQLKRHLGERYNIKGDNIFTHISKNIYEGNKKIDNKLYALKTVMNELGISKKNVVAFGDAPNGNDEAILKYAQTSFTNDSHYIMKRNTSPFYIPGKVNSVKKVHLTIERIIE